MHVSSNCCLSLWDLSKPDNFMIHLTWTSWCKKLKLISFAPTRRLLCSGSNKTRRRRLLEKIFASKRLSGVTCLESGRGFRSLGEGTGLASLFSQFHAPMRASCVLNRLEIRYLLTFVSPNVLWDVAMPLVLRRNLIRYQLRSRKKLRIYNFQHLTMLVFSRRSHVMLLYGWELQMNLLKWNQTANDSHSATRSFNVLWNVSNLLKSTSAFSILKVETNLSWLKKQILFKSCSRWRNQGGIFERHGALMGVITSPGRQGNSFLITDHALDFTTKKSLQRNEGKEEGRGLRKKRRREWFMGPWDLFALKPERSMLSKNVIAKKDVKVLHYENRTIWWVKIFISNFRFSFFKKYFSLLRIKSCQRF